MFKLHRLLILGFLLVFAVYGWINSPRSQAGPDEQSFTAELSGELAEPPVKTDATGKVTFQVKKGGMEIYYKITVNKIRDVMMAHIHMSEQGKGGAVLVWLYPKTPPPKLKAGELNGMLAEGRITKNNLQGPLKGKPLSDLINNMKEGKTIVRVHTKKYMQGEIQGVIK